MIGAASRRDREGSGEFGNSDVFLCIVQSNKEKIFTFPRLSVGQCLAEKYLHYEYRERVAGYGTLLDLL